MLSGQELSSIVDTISTILDIEDTQVTFYGENEEFLYVKNVEEKRIQRLLEVRTPVVLKQYGITPWGKVEFLFYAVNHEFRESENAFVI